MWGGGDSFIQSTEVSWAPRQALLWESRVNGESFLSEDRHSTKGIVSKKVMQFVTSEVLRKAWRKRTRDGSGGGAAWGGVGTSRPALWRWDGWAKTWRRREGIPHGSAWHKSVVNGGNSPHRGQQNLERIERRGEGNVFTWKTEGLCTKAVDGQEKLEESHKVGLQTSVRDETAADGPSHREKLEFTANNGGGYNWGGILRCLMPRGLRLIFQSSTHGNDSSVSKRLCKLQQISSVMLTPLGVISRAISGASHSWSRQSFLEHRF